MYTNPAPTYRYFFNVLGNRVPCKQFGSVKIKHEKDQAQKYVIRRKLSGEQKFIGDDYRLLEALEQSADRCTVVGFEIEQYVGNNLWTPFWKGKFSVTDAKLWDKSNCHVTFSIVPDDEYTLLFEEYEKKRNILAVEEKTAVSVKIDVQNAYEFTTTNYTKNGEQGREEDYYGLFLTHKVKESSGLLGFVKEFKRYIYFREVAFTSPSNVDEAGELIPPSGSDWNVVEQTVTTIKWARMPQLSGFYPYDMRGVDILGIRPELIFADCNAVAPEGFLEISPCVEWKPLGNKKVFWRQGTYNLTRGPRFIDVLSYLVSQSNPDLVNANGKIKSDLFTASTSPIDRLPNKLQNMLIYQASDVKGYFKSEAAKKGMISLKSLLEELRIMFNAYYRINADGIFELEHLSFFESGQASIDTTRPEYKYNAHKKAYEYLKAKMPRYERLEFAQPGEEGFESAEIEYEGNCINRKTKGKTNSLILYLRLSLM
jgi:hypothetical protein